MKTKYINFADRNFFKLEDYEEEVPLMTFDELASQPDVSEVDLFIVKQFEHFTPGGQYMRSPKDKSIISTDMFVNLPHVVKQECSDLKEYDAQMYIDFDTAYLVKYHNKTCQLTHVTIIPNYTSKEQ